MEAVLENQQPQSPGFILSLAELKRALEIVSTESRQWWVRPAPINELNPRVLVGYRDRARVDLVNDLCFVLPVLQRGDSDRDTLICAHPEALTPDLVGLYLEPDGIRQDSLADFMAFWEPLQVVLANEVP